MRIREMGKGKEDDECEMRKRGRSGDETGRRNDRKGMVGEIIGMARSRDGINKKKRRRGKLRME